MSLLLHRAPRARSIMRRRAGLCLWLVLLLAPAGAALAATTPAHTILVFGDSLSAAHGMPQDQGWVALMAKRLAKRDAGFKVVNASVSGETTGGGLDRFPAALAHSHPDIVILELGGNDGLQVLPLKQMQSNLAAMIEKARAAGARVLLLGMRLPPNYGAAYTKRFHAVFDALAKRYQTAYDPFFLAPVAGNRANFQPGGIHPKASVQPQLASRVLSDLAPLLKNQKTTNKR